MTGWVMPLLTNPLVVGALVAAAFPIFSIRCFPNFRAAVAGGSAIRVAMTFAMICQSRLKMPLPDCSRIFQSRYRLNVMAVQAVARLMAASQAPVEHVVVLVGFGRSRAFLLLNAPVMPVRAWGRSFLTRAALVAVKAVFNAPKHWQFRFRPVLIPAPGSGFRARVKPGFVAGRQVIFIFLSMLTLIQSLPVMAAICMRVFPCQ